MYMRALMGLHPYLPTRLSVSLYAYPILFLQNTMSQKKMINKKKETEASFRGTTLGNVLLFLLHA
jgi:hypothetical protein